MKTKLINNEPRTRLVIFEDGDEVLNQLSLFAAHNSIGFASLQGIGAFSSATIGYFDFSIKDYKKIEVNEQVEVLSIIGNISMYENKPKVHAHVLLGKADGSTIGGHFLKGTVHPTLEVVLTEGNQKIERLFDDETNLPLIKLI
ncbi:MAG: DNA-binding protein [Bacteroidetes bacterium]|nr:DNA-binding protein [Bacteroidota bacterium]